ncbi:HAD-IA family hydrolase [Celeribacter sp.]|uniref:HAD-IA family hydrolase n=1 Tax=Celeribacter sp. TaxID=1890673 RepID=UPI003A92D6C0
MTRLVIFDVDGTLVDSQAHIVAAMTAAFEAVDLTPPSRDRQLAIVGLSLPYAIAELAPEADTATQAEIVENYKRVFHELRMAQGAAASPLFDGAEEAVRRLGARDDTLLAIATGKSRRGLNALMADWDFSDLFISDQCADDHPSKPHPSMVQTCMADAGVSAAETVVVGDTTYDMEMARAARCTGLGVDWGYHGASALREVGAVDVLHDFSQIDAALDTIFKG